jgi:hypothetical protein
MLAPCRSTSNLLIAPMERPGPDREVNRDSDRRVDRQSNPAVRPLEQAEQALATSISSGAGLLRGASRISKPPPASGPRHITTMRFAMLGPSCPPQIAPIFDFRGAYGRLTPKRRT